MSPTMTDDKKGIDISKLTDADVGRRVYYVPSHVRQDPEITDWIGHPHTEWGRISSWSEKYVHVQFGDKPDTQACIPEDLFPEHLGAMPNNKR